MAEVVVNALIRQCSNKRVAGCLREGLKCGLTAGSGAAVGFLLGGPIGCAIGGFVGASFAAKNSKGPSLVTILSELSPEERNDVAWELLEALKSASVISATTNMPVLANIISKGENLEQIFAVLMQIIQQFQQQKS